MIRSMTAYASAEGELDGWSIVWELRSVNHRFLDVSLRLPESLRFLELEARSTIGAQLRRGRVECGLTVRNTGAGVAGINVNKSLVTDLLQSAGIVEQMAERPLGAFSALDVLRWPGVIEESDLNRERFAKEILAVLECAITRSVAMRIAEGGKLAALMEERLVRVEENVAQIKARMPEVNTVLREKFNARLAEVTANPDRDRLEQELVFWVQKLDVSEEVDRLGTHVDEFRCGLRQTEPAGRRLDFLLQEMNREANTLGSKSSDSETTKATVEIKVLIEQLREQVQNVE